MMLCLIAPPLLVGALIGALTGSTGDVQRLPLPFRLCGLQATLQAMSGYVRIPFRLPFRLYGAQNIHFGGFYNKLVTKQSAHTVTRTREQAS